MEDQNNNFLSKIKPRYLHEFFGLRIGPLRGDIEKRGIEKTSRSGKIKYFSFSVFEFKFKFL